MIYLDNAATTKPRKEVVDCVQQYMTNRWFNPSALYSHAIQVRSDIESARKNISKFINADSDEIYFTSGATESNNWILRGFVDYCMEHKYKPVIVVSAIEHKSITDCLAGMMSIFPALVVYECAVDKNGFIDIKQLQYIFDNINNFLFQKCKYKVLTSIQYANSEIGTIQPISDIANLVHRYGAMLHTDVTQAFLHIPIDVQYEHIDMLSASAQKCGGLKGTGILYKAKDCDCIKPLIYGSQENGNRGGTENVIGIMAMSEAVNCCRILQRNNNAIIGYRNYFIRHLITKFNCKINGVIGDYYHAFFDNRLPNNINVTFPQNITGEVLIYMLDSAGIMIASGSACNSRTNQLSSVLKAIGLTDEEIMRTIRITISDDITKEEIDTVIDEIDKIIKILLP